MAAQEQIREGGSVPQQTGIKLCQMCSWESPNARWDSEQAQPCGDSSVQGDHGLEINQCR